MKRVLISAGLGAALLLWSNSAALAHGGQYRGPGDTVPPNLGGGGDTTAPGNPGGPGTPGPGAPTTGGAGRGPTTGPGPGVPGAGGAGTARPTTGGAGFVRRGGGEGFEQWQFWWEHNKEPFLRLKERLGGGQVTSGSAGFLIGRVKQNEAVSSIRPSAQQVKNEIIPELLPLLQESEADVVDSSVLAIARMLRVDDAADVLADLTATVGHAQKTPREAATLALGVLGSKDALQVLTDLMMDTTEGRKLNNNPAGVEDQVRAFAAASLGMIGDPASIESLMSVVTDSRINSRDLKALAIQALGLMPQNHEVIVPFLLDLMKDRSLDRIVQAQAPIALGKLNSAREGSESPAAVSQVGKVIQMFQDDKADDNLRRSLANCLGMLANMSDPAGAEAIDVLIDAVAKSSDDQTRHFAIMALAQIGGRDADPAQSTELHQKLENFFLQELVKPKKITHQPYGALGLAVYARNEAIEGLRGRAADKILETFDKANNPSYKGAMAVGLGLLGAKKAQESLWEEFEDSNDQQLKGYIALSLGLMGVNKHADSFRSAVRAKGLDFKFRLQLARSLGLMGDVDAVNTLVDYLEKAETLSESSSSAQALGLIGDKSAVEPLMTIIRDQRKQPLQRGFACVALGIIAEKDDLPWNVLFSVNANYRAKVPALSEILDIL